MSGKRRNVLHAKIDTVVTARFLIAAAHKSSGKTVISTGLAAAFVAAGQKLQTFKKGPDYIDPMWLASASARPCYNLDFNTMDADELLALFADRSADADLAMIEANKGLFDGVDLDGSDSNAAMAKLIGAPVILVIDTNGMTRGIAPLLQGYQAFDPAVNIAGVILNKVGGARHESKLRAAVAAYCDIPVIGAVWRNRALEIGERHLGLTTPAETGELAGTIAEIGRIIGGSVDLSALAAIADTAEKMAKPMRLQTPTSPADLRIGIARDTAFGFYYPDDLDAFAKAGARLIPIDTLSDAVLPGLDGLFIGGGFPEAQMPALAANVSLRTNIRQAIENGLPTYAECGGLMYLCERMIWNGDRREMVGVIPGDAVMCAKPQGRGYARFTNSPAHPWATPGKSVKAHEFHYARLENLKPGLAFGRAIERGAGIDGHYDAIVIHNLVAGFCHLRSTRDNPWVKNFVDFVRSKKA